MALDIGRAAIIATLLYLCTAEFTDEIQVFEEHCLGDNVYHCEDGGCIMLDLYCDGKPDCKDESDESFCAGVHYHINVTSCNRSHEFSCHDSSRCIPYTWLCNGVADCDDGSDEKVCSGRRLEDLGVECKGFKCKNGVCISWLWVCDGQVDCEDKSDEYNETLCRQHKPKELSKFDLLNCEDELDVMSSILSRRYPCDDRSFCLKEAHMCDGVKDCRDGSDEGEFCVHWPTMCSNHNCSDDAACKKTPKGPTCECNNTVNIYSYENNTCVDRDECAEAFPRCSHKCINTMHPFRCLCEDGYTVDRFRYLCFASDPEALLFFSTRNEIRYYKLKSREQVTVITGLKQAHGVTYDGTYLYWVETADGHQAIVRARLDNVAETKQTLVSIGLEEPEDIAIDWINKLIYFSDSERGHIAACYADGAMCTILNSTAMSPRFVTLYPQKGEMFWADYHNRSLIMRANMDGSESRIFVDKLRHFPTGLTLDIPSDRLFYVDESVYGVRLDGKGQYVLVESVFHHPYALAVFENTVFWSDWASNTLQACDKVNPTPSRRRVVTSMDAPIVGLHIYHPLLVRPALSPCEGTTCSDLCLPRAGGRVCACSQGRRLVEQTLCAPSFHEVPQFLVVGGGRAFTRLRYNELGNPESRAVDFDIGRVQAMAYNNNKRILYIYDGQRKTINFISLNNFSKGTTEILEHKNLDNVLDMDYDYVADVLYFADAGRHVIEALSIRTGSRAVVHRFTDETPISLCVIPDYGLMMVAVVSDEDRRVITVDSMGLDGKGRRHVLNTGLKGPHIRLRYHQSMDYVYISDEGNGVIDYIHPTGTGRENYRELSTTVTSLAASDSMIFWTDRRTPRLFWSGVHETAQTIRRIDMTVFPPHSQLVLQATPSPPARSAPPHPCATRCQHVCVQISHPTPLEVPMQYSMGYTCLCPSGLTPVGDDCEPLRSCHEEQVYCHSDNTCVQGVRCDGVKSCKGGEDEEDCKEPKTKCSNEEKLCKGLCINKNTVCNQTFEPAVTQNSTCNLGDFECPDSLVCLPRWQLCDGSTDCPDGGGDEAKQLCDQIRCNEDEFQCTSRSCIWKSWRCDGYPDCADGSDEVDCVNSSCSQGFYQCGSGECVPAARRCDGVQHCRDYSDEEECGGDLLEEEEPPGCEENEYTCQLNRSICLPLSARCNTKVDCPGGTDELECGFACMGNPALFQCEQEHSCVLKWKLCDGVQDCLDGSDEAAWNCPSSKPLPARVEGAPCARGYRCASGQCVEWRAVCDQRTDCFDNSDEGSTCFTACENSTCDHSCQPTPYGRECQCAAGFSYDKSLQKCVDVDECPAEPCAQRCLNLPGSFVCSCFHGYTLRADRRSCKAIKGHMSIMYVNGNTVKTAEGNGSTAVYYRHSAAVKDIDFNFRANKLYSISQEDGQLVEVSGNHSEVVVTNIGKPYKLAVDWVTGNVYVVSSVDGRPHVRVCSLRLRRCARLQRLPPRAQVTAFIVDPANNRMFYCLTQDEESVIWSATLSGGSPSDLGSARGCKGLAADSFRRRLYVAEGKEARVSVMSYEGDGSKTVLADNVHLQYPLRIAVFEDHLYYLVANSFHIARCPLMGSGVGAVPAGLGASPVGWGAGIHCQPYLYRVFDADTFALIHETAQRDDILNLCEGYKCSGICVIEESAQCICEDGNLTKDGSDCAPVDKKHMALFNGYSRADFERRRWPRALLAALLALGAALLVLLVLYYFVYKPRRGAPNPLMVRFQNTAPKEGGSGEPAGANEPSVEIGSGASRHEFVNPLQYVRDLWRQSFRRPQRPVGTAALSFDVPNEDSSDTESEQESHDTRGLFAKQ